MALNLDVIGKKIGPASREYDWKDVVLYALGVGAGYDDLEYVYEAQLKVIPSFAATAIYDFFQDFVMGSGVNLAGIVHGEHELIIHRPIPPQGGEITSEGRITHMYDKGEGRGALVIGQVDTYDADGRPLFTNVATLFARLDGGFGGEDAPKTTFEFPDREPDVEETDRFSADQPLIYRLSGDTFALHVDPDFARMSGFDGPIVHGLCTHGYACRAVIKHLFPGEPERMTRFSNRFSRPIYPGTPITTQIWRMEESEASDANEANEANHANDANGGRALFRTINADTGDVVIDRGVVEWVSAEEAQRRAEGIIRFDGQVAIVTGAGGGLGRVYALELALRGAKVVVNDLGGARDGSGSGSARPADAVVREIQEAGGEAIANYDSVATPEGGEAIIQTALNQFGRVDILINNAGILRDKSFAKMEPAMWEGVLDVHLHGAYHVTRPAFQAMKEQGYGRIVMTTSAAGLFGNFGQTNYSAAKLGLVGMMNTLKEEGAKYGIKVNTVAPLAWTRLTEDVLPPDFEARLQPEFVAPVVLYLCSEACPVTGRIYNAGAGYFSRAAVVSGHGTWLGDEGDIPTPEEVAAQWAKITSLKGGQEYPNANAALMDMLTPKPDIETGPEAEAGAGKGAAPGGWESVAEVFDHMAEFFQPDRAGGVNVVFQFTISGPGGGEWHTVIEDGTCTVASGAHASPTTTLKMSEEDFLKYIGGQLPAMQAYTSGKLKIEGDLMKSQLIEKVFKF